MRNRNIFRDFGEADNWLNSHLLTNRNPITDRLFQSTRLTDLIYSGLSFEDVFYNTENLKFPVNAERISQDMFGALFSPVIRKNDNESLFRRERMFNKPLMDRVLRDDRFDTLKSLCEDKEMTSYDAASVFAHTLQELLNEKPYEPETNYLIVIKTLEGQIEGAIAEIQAMKADKKINPDRYLVLVNKIRAKLSQVKNLEKRLKKDALIYIQSIEEDINIALDTAVNRAAETHSIMSAWGNDSGEMKSTPLNRELLDYVKKSEELRRIAVLLGRYREIIADKRKNGYAYGLGEKYDLTTGNDITNCLSSELALLGTPETEILFMRKYEQKRLQQYRKRTQVIKGKGDMIVLVDESSSTRRVTGWAKAFTLALLDIAARDKRKFAVVHFASARDIKTDLFEPDKYTSQDVMKAAEHFWGGGTNFEAPFKEAIRLMENGYENADITIITDGECEMSDTFCEELHTKLQSYKATVTGILLDKDEPCGTALEPFCDKIYHSKDLTEDEIAIDIIQGKAA